MIASQLRAALEKNDLPTRELAAASGVPITVLLKFHKYPNATMIIEHAEALARVLGLQLTLGPTGPAPIATETKKQNPSIGFINRYNQQIVGSRLKIRKGRPVRLYKLQCQTCQGPEYEVGSYIITTCPHCKQ